MRTPLVERAVPRCIEVWSEGKEEPDRYQDGYILLVVEEETIREIVVLASRSIPDRLRILQHLTTLLGDLSARIGQYSGLELGMALLRESCQECEERESCLLCKKMKEE